MGSNTTRIIHYLSETVESDQPCSIKTFFERQGRSPHGRELHWGKRSMVMMATQ